MQKHSLTYFIHLLIATGAVQGVACDSTTEEIELSPREELAAAFGGPQAVAEFTGIRYIATGSTAIEEEGLEPGTMTPTGDFERLVAYHEASDAIRIDHEGMLLFELLNGAPQAFSEVIVGKTGTVTSGESVIDPSARSIPSDRLASTRRRIELLNPIVLLRSMPNDAIVRGEKLILDGKEHRTFILNEGTNEVTFVVSTADELAQVRTQESHRLHRDVSLIVDYSEWTTIVDTSSRMPREVQITVNDKVILNESHSEIEVSPTFENEFFQLDQEAGPMISFNAVDFERGRASHHWHQAFSGLGIPLDGIVSEFEASELSPGIFLLSGGGGVHNTMIIEQNDGVVVVDGPVAPEQAATIVAWIENQFGGKAISHVVPSHFHLDHASGVRELAGAGAQVITVARMKGFWEELLAASSAIIPDRQSRLSEGTVTSFADSGSMLLADVVNPVSALHIPDNAHAADMLLITAETTKATYVYVADLYGPFGGSFIVGGPEDFLRGLQQHQLIDNSCTPTSPLIVVGAHGGVETIEESITFIEGLGIDLSTVCQELSISTYSDPAEKFLATSIGVRARP